MLDMCQKRNTHPISEVRALFVPLIFEKHVLGTQDAFTQGVFLLVEVYWHKSYHKYKWVSFRLQP